MQKGSGKYMARQGDVLLISVADFPAGLKKKDNTVALGEATGHSHRFVGKQVSVYADQAGQQYAHLQAGTELVHEEHENIAVPKGKYKVVLQREQDIVGEVRQVLD